MVTRTRSETVSMFTRVISFVRKGGVLAVLEATGLVQGVLLC